MIIITQDFDTSKALVAELSRGKTPWTPVKGILMVQVRNSAKVKAAVHHVRNHYGTEAVEIVAVGQPRPIPPQKEGWKENLRRGNWVTAPYRTICARGNE